MKEHFQSELKVNLGEERYEAYRSRINKGRRYIQYDYRHTDGRLFSCVTTDLRLARSRRDAWLKAVE